MKKLCLTATLATITICTVNTRIAAMSSLKRMALRQAFKNDFLKTAPADVFESQESLTRFFDALGIKEITGLLPEVARVAYLSVKGNKQAMPAWLRSHFEGVSIQDLIDNDMLPEIIFGSLDLSSKNINNLTGLQHIPNIGSIKILYFFNNLITNLAPDEFTSLYNLSDLYLDSNHISIIAPLASDDLGNLQGMSFLKKETPKAEPARIQAEVDSNV